MKRRALVLAAGRGSRMGTATDNSHKCLTMLAGKTLLNWQLISLKIAGINEITVVRGYKAEMLSGKFSVINNERWAKTNMVVSLFCAPSFDGETIISYSDIVYKPEHVKALVNVNANVAITADTDWFRLWTERFEKPEEDAETFISKDGLLKEIGGKTKNTKEIQAQYMGLLKFSQSGWSQAFQLFKSYPPVKQDKTDITSLLADLLRNKINISVVLVNGGWCEVDNYNDVLIYEKALNKFPKWHHDWR